MIIRNLKRINVTAFMIALLVFATIGVVLFSEGDKINEQFVDIGESTSIAEEHLADYGVDETQALMTDISGKSPGGSEGLTGTSGTSSDTDIDLGYRTGALILKGPGIFKKMVFGNNETGTEGILSKLGVRSEFSYLIVSAIVFAIAIILISSLLRNKI